MAALSLGMRSMSLHTCRMVTTVSSDILSTGARLRPFGYLMPHRGNMQLRLIRVKPSMRTWVTTWSILVLQRNSFPMTLSS